MNASIETLAKIANQATDLNKTATTEKPGYLLPLVPVTGAQPYAATADVFMAVVPRASVRFRRLVVAVYVATLNDATNFWTINLKTDSLGIVASVDTSGVTVATWTMLETTSFSPEFTTQAADVHIDIGIVKTLAAGTLRLLPYCYVL